MPGYSESDSPRRADFAKLFVAVCLIGILQACVSVKNIPSDYRLSEDSDHGVLLASVTYQGSYSGYSIFFRPVGGTRGQSLSIGASQALVPPGMRHWDIEYPGTRGQVFAVELPAGEYELYTWLVGSGAATSSPSEEFSIRFEIRPGEPTYAGNFNFRRTGRLGATVTGVNVMHQDQFARDIPIILDKFSKLNLTMVNLGISEEEETEMVGGVTKTHIMIPVIL